MKNILIFVVICFVFINAAWANYTRMNTFMTGDYIDDVTNINAYPEQVIMYYNNLYGDITGNAEDYGIIITPDEKYGAIACWQNQIAGRGFHIGYAINIANFDLGVSGSPVEDNTELAVGIGRTRFNRRWDLAFHMKNEDQSEWYRVHLRIMKRKGDFVIVPRYSLNIVQEPYDNQDHKIGVMFQRLILNEGFVYLAGEYAASRGDYENDYSNIYAGLELPIGRKFTLLLGAYETFTDGFESPTWQIETGLGMNIRGFRFNIHINEERFFNKDVTIFNSFGLDFGFRDL